MREGRTYEEKERINNGERREKRRKKEEKRKGGCRRDKEVGGRREKDGEGRWEKGDVGEKREKQTYYFFLIYSGRENKGEG